MILKIRPWYDSDNVIEDIFWVLPKGSQWEFIVPSRMLNPNAFRNSTAIQMADPEFWKPNEISIILGAGFFAKMIISVVERTMDGTAVLETEIGIVIFGTESEQIDENTGQVLSTIEYNEEEQLDKLLERLWLQDEIKPMPKLTQEEMEVEKHFVETHYRDKNGRFVTKIPLTGKINNLGSSRQIALRRYMYSERKRMKDANLNAHMIEKMRELIKLGYAVPVTEKQKPGEIVYHIPYHCVAKGRVVYDASCKTDRGISLNEVQKLGAKLQKELDETLMRFRRHRIAIYADIRKMYNQIQLAKEQWNLQRVFWRENENDPLREYWLTVIIFGLSSAPFIAVRSIIQCATEAKDKYPKAAKRIEEDFYMDDCVTGDDNEDQAIQLAGEMGKILKGAGFELRQWKSNSKALVKAMDSEIESSTLLSAAEGTTILGLKWLIKEDKFTFVVKSKELQGEITKRKIVSYVAQLYDPIGYISPVTVRGRILIQHLWRSKIGWDDKPSSELEKSWIDFWNEIIYLEQFTIDRWIGTGNGSKVHIHGFSDSGEPALGAVIYIRVEHANGKITSKLLTSKSKVAPLKSVSIPRLELSAAELLSRLLRHVMHSMEWSQVEYTLWTDSSAVFHWLRKSPRELKTYVANRVSSIQTITDIKRWRHINGKENPADLLTRGISPKELIDNQLWLHGPEWLILPQDQWPESNVMQEIANEITQEIKVESNVFAVTEFKGILHIGIKGIKKSVPLLEYTSKLEKAINIISYVNRFIKNWLDKSKRGKKSLRSRDKGIYLEVSPPTLEEKAVAMEYLLRNSQQEYFKKEVKALKGEGTWPEKSSLEPLKPIMDDKGLMRVGGRLDRSSINYEMKHPVIIPNGSRLSHLIMDYTHRLLKHAGAQAMIQSIREKYWIPKIRNEARRHIHKCVVCVRYNAQTVEQLMAELPGERTQIGKAFINTGVDYAGPFELTMVSGDGKGVKRKCWIAVFVCLKTRAVHLDVVTDYTAISFIACYERFIARRGRCEKLVSDNGTPFVGADKELQRAIKKWTEKEMLTIYMLKVRSGNLCRQQHHIKEGFTKPQ